MERYKVDQLKKGKELYEKYVGKAGDTGETSPKTTSNRSTQSFGATQKKKNVTMAERRLEEGKRLFDKYVGPQTFNREQLYQHMQKKEAEKRLAQEYAATKTKQPAATKVFSRPQTSANGTKPYSNQEFTQMVLDYAKRNPERGKQNFRASSGLTYSGKRGNISYTQAQKDPGYKDYVKKGSQSKEGYSDGFIGQLKTAAKTRLGGLPEGRAEFLDDDEKNMYNYLLGKYGWDTAKEFEQSLGDVTAARLRHDETKNVREASRRNIIAGVGYNAAGALASPEGYIYAATKMGIDKAKEIKALMNAESTDEYKNILEEYKKRNTPVDTNNEAFSGNAIMNASNQGIKDAIGGTPVRDFAIDTGLSITQAMSRLPLGPLNVAVAGGSAATDAYVDAAERGATRYPGAGTGRSAGHGRGCRRSVQPWKIESPERSTW